MNHELSFIVDLETSGNCPIKNGVISFCLIVCNKYLTPIDEFFSYVRPPDLSPLTWSIETEKYHKKSIAEVMTYKPNDQFCYELLCFLAKYKNPSNWPMPFICHASPNGMPKLNKFGRPDGSFEIHPWFDYYFLEWCFRKARFQNSEEMVWAFWKVFNSSNLISTVQMGRETGHKTNKLSDWAARVEFKLNHHDPRSDAYCCLKVYDHLRKIKNNDFVTIGGEQFTNVNIPF